MRVSYGHGTGTAQAQVQVQVQYAQGKHTAQVRHRYSTAQDSTGVVQ